MRILPLLEVKRHILNSVVSANTAGKSIRYKMGQKDVQICLNGQISLRIIQRLWERDMWNKIENNT